MTYLKNTVTLQLDETRCTGCSRCIEVCPHQVFTLFGKKVKITDRDACMECSACVMNCPFKALTVVRGVGCAAAVIYGFLHKTQPDCGSGCCGSAAAANQEPAEKPAVGCCGGSVTGSRETAGNQAAPCCGGSATGSKTCC